MTAVLGHDAQRAEMRAAAMSGRMHHGWLLTGPQGVGKGMFARDLVPELQAGPAQEATAMERLVAAGSHPDYIELHRLERDTGELARNISVAQVRGLHRLLDTAPSIAARRVILIDSADDLEASGANALLKSLEEPPPNTVFLLISHSPARLLPTIRSRCRVLRFSPLDEGDMRRALRAAADARGEPMDAAELDHLVTLGAGAPGQALSLLGVGVEQLRASLDRIATSGDPDNGERTTLARALSTKSARPRYEAFLRLVPTYLAEQTRGRSGTALADVLGAYALAGKTGGGAVALGLDPAAVVFTLCGQVARLHRA